MKVDLRCVICHSYMSFNTKPTTDGIEFLVTPCNCMPKLSKDFLKAFKIFGSKLETSITKDIGISPVPDCGDGDDDLPF